MARKADLPNRSKSQKSLGRKTYESIGHLPGSRQGPGDHCVTSEQARICTVQTRNALDRVIVHEKLDGSCTAVALVAGVIYALRRSGESAETSPFEQHRMFAEWVRVNEDRFRAVLRDGERLVGEWLAQAHGTRYDLTDHEPWGVFDLMIGSERLPIDEFRGRVGDAFAMPSLLHDGSALPVDAAMLLHEAHHRPGEAIEGVVYRVERSGKVEFLAKWVRPTKVDGRYLPDVSGGDPVWNGARRGGAMPELAVEDTVFGRPSRCRIDGEPSMAARVVRRLILHYSGQR